MTLFGPSSTSEITPLSSTGLVIIRPGSPACVVVAARCAEEAEAAIPNVNLAGLGHSRDATDSCQASGFGIGEGPLNRGVIQILSSATSVVGRTVVTFILRGCVENQPYGVPARRSARAADRHRVSFGSTIASQLRRNRLGLDHRVLAGRGSCGTARYPRA